MITKASERAVVLLTLNEKRKLIRYLQAARRRITPISRWCYGAMALDKDGYGTSGQVTGRRPVQWCALGSIAATLERNHGNPALQRAGKDLLTDAAWRVGGRGGSMVSLNDGYLMPDDAAERHAKVLKAYDLAIETLKEMTP